MTWKRLILMSASFGAGFAIVVSLIFGGVVLYQSRPRSWNTNALKAHFQTMELSTQPQQDSFILDFIYDIENKTNRDYEIVPLNLTVLANLTEGQSLSKEFGHYQTSDAVVSGPPFIPAQGKARISIRVTYAYPSEFTANDKNDLSKVTKSVDRRLQELSSLAIFDKTHYYRIDLPEGWKKLAESDV